MIWKKWKNDMLLILALVLLAGGVWVYVRCTRSAGGEALVTVDGVTVAVLPLAENASLTLRPGSGFAAGSGFENTVTVADGCVFVCGANCPDHVCERQGRICYDGEMIICLPHRLIVTVRGGARGADALAQ